LRILCAIPLAYRVDIWNGMWPFGVICPYMSHTSYVSYETIIPSAL